MQTLTHQLERKENEVEKAQEKVRKANADLDAMKRSKQTTTTQLRDAHEKEVDNLSLAITRSLIQTLTTTTTLTTTHCLNLTLSLTLTLTQSLCYPSLWLPADVTTEGTASEGHGHDGNSCGSQR